MCTTFSDDDDDGYNKFHFIYLLVNYFDHRAKVYKSPESFLLLKN